MQGRLLSGWIEPQRLLNFMPKPAGSTKLNGVSAQALCLPADGKP